MDYKKGEIINRLNSLNKLEDLYIEKMINYKGNNKDTKEKNTEVIAKELLDNPAKGSFGYLVSYTLLTFIITIIGKLEFNYKIEIAMFALIYLSLCILTLGMFRKKTI